MTYARRFCLVRLFLNAGSRSGGRQRGEQVPQVPGSGPFHSAMSSFGRRDTSAECSMKGAWGKDADEAAGGWGSKQACGKHSVWD